MSDDQIQAPDVHSLLAKKQKPKKTATYLTSSSNRCRLHQKILQPALEAVCSIFIVIRGLVNLLS